MPAMVSTIISTLTSLLLAPILLGCCLVLYPFAVLTTYFAFVTLFIRAAIVHLQVVTALIRRTIGFVDDFSSPSSWAPKLDLEESGFVPEQWSRKRRPIITTPRIQTFDVDLRTALDNNLTRTTGIPIPGDDPPSRGSSSSDRSPATPTIRQSRSRPSSSHSPIMARDYEGVGGWYTFPSKSVPGPEPESASLEWLVTNARLELPDADAASLTRPRTPEEIKRSSSLSGRSHRSMVSLQRRSGHERSATAGSIDIGRFSDTYSLQSTSSRASSLLERSRSQAHIPVETMDLGVGERKVDEVSKNKSMIFLTERGNKLATRFAGLKSLGLKKKGKVEISAPVTNTIERGAISSRDARYEQRSRERSGGTSETEDGNTVNGSGPSSVEGVEATGLSMWMRP